MFQLQRTVIYLLLESKEKLFTERSGNGVWSDAIAIFEHDFKSGGRAASRLPAWGVFGCNYCWWGSCDGGSTDTLHFLNCWLYWRK